MRFLCTAFVLLTVVVSPAWSTPSDGLCQYTTEWKNRVGNPILHFTSADSSEAFLWMNFSDTQGLEGLQTAAGALDDIDFNKVRISSLEIDGPNKSGACTFPGKLGETAKCELNLNRAKVWLVDKTTGAPVKTQAIKIGKVVVSVVPHPEDPKKWRLAYFDWYIGGGPMYTRDKLVFYTCYVPE